MLLPYLAVPLVGATHLDAVRPLRSVLEHDMQVLVYIGIGLVALLVVRQYVTLLHNRRLNAGLSDLSRRT